MNTDLITEAENLLTQARAHNKKGETSQALTAYQAADDLFARLDDARGRTRCWSGIAKIYGKQKSLPESAAAFGQSADYAAQADWPDKEIEGLYNQGLTLQQLGVKGANLEQVGGAIAAFERGLAVARRVGDQASAGVLLVSLGFACAWSKRDAEAIRYFRAAAPFALDNVDFDTAFSALSSLGVLLSNYGEADAAIPYYERALALAKGPEGDIVAVADTFANLGIAYEKAGRLDEALEVLDTYREILQVAGDVKLADAKAMVKRIQQKMKLQKPL